MDNNIKPSLNNIPQDKFLSLSFEELTQVEIRLQSSAQNTVGILNKETGVVESIPNFLDMPLEVLVRIPVRVSGYVTEGKKDEDNLEEVQSGTNIDVDIASVFSTQSVEIRSFIMPKVESEEKELETENTSTTSTTTTTVPVPPPDTVIPIIPILPTVQFLALVNTFTATVSTYINNNGTFSVQPPLALTATLGGGCIAIGDLNKDGFLDLAVTNGSAFIDIFFANGVGTFGASNSIVLTDSLNFIQVADFNGDGILDLAAANATLNTVSILLGLGNGVFGPENMFALTSNPSAMVIADFNKDGALDIAAVGLANSNLSILLGTGTGAFTPPVDYTTTGPSGFSIVAGDFNEDGILDLAVAINFGSVAIFIGDGNGGFGPAMLYPSPGFGHFVDKGDINNDGHLDLVVGSTATGTVGILLGDGTGQFSLFNTIPASTQGYGVLGDFNRDGNLDLAVTQTSQNNMLVYLGDGNGLFQSPILYSTGTSPGFLAAAIVPAGISGAPINLALGSVLSHGEILSLTIRDIPLDWSLNRGVNNLDGSWSLPIYDIENVMITSSENFVGARALQVEMSSMMPEGVIEHRTIIDNVEVYAPNMPIFALPIGDNLSGSLEADVFVISKSAAQREDTIFNFDVQQDKINLLSFSNTHAFSDLDIIELDGNTLISLSSKEHSILLEGIESKTLSEHNFLFDIEPYTLNVGSIDIGLDAIMPFRGIFENEGVIHIEGKMIMSGTLRGSGTIFLGTEGILELTGCLEHTLNFETPYGLIMLDNTDIVSPSMTAITLQMLIENYPVFI